MSIIDYKINGQTYYTHETWLSSRQRRALFHIPQQNNNLAIYYTLSTLACVAIGHKKIPLVSAYFKQLGFYAGTAGLGAASFLGWSLIMKSRTSFQSQSVIQSNDCLYTPFWKSQDGVVNLKKAALTDNFAANRYVNRGKGYYSKKQHIEKFKPDFILENPKASQLYEAELARSK